MKFVKPEMERILFDPEDVIATSGESCSGECKGYCSSQCWEVCAHCPAVS